MPRQWFVGWSWAFFFLSFPLSSTGMRLCPIDAVVVWPHNHTSLHHAALKYSPLINSPMIAFWTPPTRCRILLMRIRSPEFALLMQPPIGDSVISTASGFRNLPEKPDQQKQQLPDCSVRPDPGSAGPLDYPGRFPGQLHWVTRKTCPWCLWAAWAKLSIAISSKLLSRENKDNWNLFSITLCR